MYGAVASDPTLTSRPHGMLYLYAARAARGLGDGFAFIILPAYLSELGFDPFQIGLMCGAVASDPTLTSRPHGMLYLYAARAARGLGDGFAFIILPAYLSELGFDPFQLWLV